MLAELIPKLAAMRQEEDHFYHPRPSLAGPDRCIRQMVYWGLGFPREPFPGRAILVMDDSAWHEELTVDWLRKSAYQIHSQQLEVSCRLPMRKGHIDFLFTGLDHLDRLCEHKAINHFTFQKYWDGEFPQDYIAQTCIYLDGLQVLNPDINEAVLLIKNKNTAAYLEYLLRFNGADCTVVNRVSSQGETKEMGVVLDGVVQRACSKFEAVDDFILRKTLPKRQYDIDDWHCNYCGWGKVCWEGYDKEFLELRTDALLPSEVADMVRYYKELGAHQKAGKKEYDGLRDKIRAVMKENNAREGRAGEFFCRLKLDKAGKERLYISNPKKKEATEDGVCTESDEDQGTI